MALWIAKKLHRNKHLIIVTAVCLYFRRPGDPPPLPGQWVGGAVSVH